MVVFEDVTHRCTDAFRTMRDFSEFQPHFDCAQGADQHGFVEITQVPDAKDLFSATPGGVTRGAPLLGEHTREVLAEYGYGDDEIDALICDGVVIAM